MQELFLHLNLDRAPDNSKLGIFSGRFKGGVVVLMQSDITTSIQYNQILILPAWWSFEFK